MSSVPMNCPKCGKPHDPRYCNAHNRSGSQCSNWPQPGQKVCHLHGGRAPRARARAAAAIELAQVTAIANTYGLPKDVDPHTALLEEIARTNGHVHWLSAVIRSLSPDVLTWNMQGGSASIEVQTGAMAGKKTSASLTEGSGINAWLQLYHQERAHLVAVCKAAIGAGIEERRVRIAEQQGELLASVIRGILGDLGIIDDPRVPDVVSRRLREVCAA